MVLSRQLYRGGAPLRLTSFCAFLARQRCRCKHWVPQVFYRQVRQRLRVLVALAKLTAGGCGRGRRFRLDPYTRFGTISASMKLSSAILLVAVFISGCRGQSFDLVQASTLNSSGAQDQFSKTWNAAIDVLRKHRFRIDQTDRRSGSITTHPVGSQHFFEFWRDDVVTPGDYWEATVCSIRRRVAVKIGRDEGSVPVSVIVRKERLSAPERQLTNSSDAALFLSQDLPGTEPSGSSGSQGPLWQQFGRDSALENRLRELVLEEAGR